MRTNSEPKLEAKLDPKPRRKAPATDPKLRDTAGQGADQGIRKDQRGQEQPADKQRAQKNR